MYVFHISYPHPFPTQRSNQREIEREESKNENT